MEYISHGSIQSVSLLSHHGCKFFWGFANCAGSHGVWQLMQPEAHFALIAKNLGLPETAQLEDFRAATQYVFGPCCSLCLAIRNFAPCSSKVLPDPRDPRRAVFPRGGGLGWVTATEALLDMYCAAGQLFPHSLVLSCNLRVCSTQFWLWYGGLLVAKNIWASLATAFGTSQEQNNLVFKTSHAGKPIDWAVGAMIYEINQDL